MLEVLHLTKYFGRKLAVDDVSFRVEKGEVLGFLGPNGAGKSTTMRMITGFYPPSAGTVIISGQNIHTSPISVKAKLGYLPENAPTYKDMTVNEFLDFIASVRGFSGRDKPRRIEKTIESCFLSEVRFQTIDTLSKGYNQRVCFAQSILHDPEYLIMDEPTDGLDPNQKFEVRSMIKNMSKDKAIILSTHNLEEANAVCDKVIIIVRGRILARGTPESLKAKSPIHGAVRFSLRGVHRDSALKEVTALPTVRFAEIIKVNGLVVSMRAYPKNHSEELFSDIIKRFNMNGRKVDALAVEEGRLDEVFRNITLNPNSEGVNPPDTLSWKKGNVE